MLKLLMYSYLNDKLVQTWFQKYANLKNLRPGTATLMFL